MDFQQITIQGTDGKGGLNRWEGRMPFLYLDNRKINEQPAPLVTVGVGCALAASEAETLPFVIDGRPATPAEIAADFAALQKAPFGYVAPFYQKFTRCRLPDPAIDALVQKRFGVFVAALQHIFPAFTSWPETAKAGTLDLIYGVGVAGFAQYHHLTLDLQQTPPRFAAAANECASDASVKAYDARNAARKQLLLDAVAA